MHLVAIIILACVIGGGDAVRLFNGTDLRGWERKAVHGGHGGVWWVEGGCIVGDQEPDHGGGLLGTLASYGDFEISLEFLAEEPLDSGLFLRTAPNGNGYQITIDCRPGGTVAAIYASGVGGFVEENDRGLSAYRKGEWNRLRVRIQGQPPRIEVWLNGSQTADWQDTKVRLPSTGYVGLQVHGGGGAWGTATTSGSGISSSPRRRGGGRYPTTDRLPGASRYGAGVPQSACRLSGGRRSPC